MKLLEKLERYFDNLWDFKSPVASHISDEYLVVDTPSDKELKLVLTPRFSVILGGERINITINNNTMYIDTPLNIVINSNLISLTGNDGGVHLNPPSNDIDELKRTYELNRLLEFSLEECSNCEEPMKQIEKD